MWYARVNTSHCCANGRELRQTGVVCGRSSLSITGTTHFRAGLSIGACRMLSGPRTQMSRQDVSLLKDMMNVRPNNQRLFLATADAFRAGGLTELRRSTITDAGFLVQLAGSPPLIGTQSVSHGHTFPARGKDPCATAGSQKSTK